MAPDETSGPQQKPIMAKSSAVGGRRQAGKSLEQTLKGTWMGATKASMLKVNGASIAVPDMFLPEGSERTHVNVYAVPSGHGYRQGHAR